MRKSSIMKVSNAPLFREIKGSLLSYRRVFSVEARLIIKETNENIYDNPKTKSYRIYLKLAEEAFQREEFKEALPNINQCLTLLEKTSDSINNLDRARIYKFAAQVYEENYQLHNSIRFFRKCLVIVKCVLGEDNIFLPSIVYGLANSYYENYMSKEAIIYYKKFLSIKSIKATNDMELKTNIIIQIASSYNNFLGPKKSIRLLKQSLKLSKEYLEKDHILYLRILWEIVQTYLNAYKKAKAKKLFKKCFDILRNARFRKLISKEKMYDFLIEYYRTNEMPDRSLHLAKRAVKYLKRLKDDKSLSIARKYKKISHIYRDKNENEKEFYYLSKHLILFEKVTGPTNSEFLINLLEYFDLMKTRHLNRIALDRLRKLPKEFKDVMNSNKLLRIYYLFIKGSIYLELKLTKKTSKKLKELKILVIDIFGKTHPRYVDYSYLNGRNLFQRGYLDQALVVSQRAFVRSQRIYTYYSIHSTYFLSLIALIYRNKEEIAHSLQYYKRFFDVCKALGLLNTYRTKRNLLIVAALYLKQDNKQLFFLFLRKSMDLEITDEMQNISYYSYLFGTIAYYYFRFGNFKVAKRLHTKQLKILSSSDECICFRVISIFYNIALCEISLNNYSNLNQLYKMCYKLNEESVKEGEIEKINENIPTMLLIKAYFYFHHLKNYEECLSILKTTFYVQLNFNQKYSIQMFDIYKIIAEVYYEIGKYTESLRYDKLRLKVIEKTSNSMPILSFIHQRIGMVYHESSYFDKARNYFKRSLWIYKKQSITSDEEIRKIYHFIALSYMGQRKPDIALKYLNKCLVNSTISKHMSLIDTCILNSIGYANMLKDKPLLDKVLKIFKICVEAAKESNFDSKHTERLINNLAEIKRIVELEKNYRNKDSSSPESSKTRIDLRIVYPP